MSNFDKCFDLIVDVEKGFSSDLKDSGNWTGGRVGVGLFKGTKYGISAAAYPTLDIKNLTIDKAKDLYKKDYWNKIKGDSLPWPLDYLTMDFAINSGPGRAIKELQKCLHTDVDGVIGPATLRKVSDIQDMRGLCITYLIKRLVFMQNLSSWATQGKGWQNRLNTVADNADLNWSVGGVTEPTKV